jgi:putative protease
MDRSANRGCCAQPCRQRYDLLDKDGNEILDNNGEPIHQRYLLSLQDMDRSLHLAEMIEAGVTTFKIEGRLKDRDYVTNIVAYYRQLLDQLIDSNSALQHASTQSVYQYDFTPNPAKTFHRGQTDYFWHGRTPNMANWATPKSTGEQIGKVVEVRGKAIRVQLLPHIVLHNGDGLCYADKGFAINKIEGDWIYTNQVVDIQRNTILYRNSDTAFIHTLKAERRMPVDIRFEAVAAGYRLVIGNKSAIFEAEHQVASNPERALQTIHQQLSKLGDTDFIANSITIMANGKKCSNEFPYFIPISQLNQWRRETINGK